VSRPYLVLATVVAGYYLVGIVLRWVLKRPAFELVGGSAPVLALIFEVLSVPALAGAALLFLYVYQVLHRIERQWRGLADADRSL
jgi:hypothetical protein